VGGSGYYWRSTDLQNQALASTSSTAPLGDVSAFRQIAKDTLNFVRAGDLAHAKSRVDDLESTWDNAQARLRPMNPAKWSSVDQSIDTVLREMRAGQQDATACSTSLQALLTILDKLDNHG